MCEIYDMIEQKGIRIGREEGEVLGTMRTLCTLVRKKLLTSEAAAAEAGLSVSAFRQQMTKYV